MKIQAWQYVAALYTLNQTWCYRLAHSGKRVNEFAIPLAKTGFPYQRSLREQTS
jgi:hypothetical protein